MNTVLVSVVVPAFNVENYIKKCMESLINQTYRNIEIIVVNDGSTDNTHDILCEFESKDKRIKIIHQDNAGVSSARNAALKAVSGKYICFVDGDDFADVDMVEKLVEAMEDTDADLLSFQYVREDQYGNCLGNYNFIPGIFLTEEIEDKVNFILKEIIQYHIGFEVWNKCFRAEIIRDNDITFCNTCGMGEDLGFVYSYLAYTNSVKSMEIRPYHYIVRGNSAMAKVRAKDYNILQYIEFLYHAEIQWGKKYSDMIIGRSFTRIFFYTLENSVRGMNDVEISDAVRTSLHDEWVCLKLKNALQSQMLFDRNMWRHILCIADELGLLHGAKRLYLGCYNLYRYIRKREAYKLLLHS